MQTTTLVGNKVMTCRTHQKRRFDRIASCADDAPPTKKDGGCNGDTNENSIDVVNLRKGGDAPEEVDRRGNDGGRRDEQANLSMLATSSEKDQRSHHPAVAALAVNKPSCDLTSGLNDQKTAETLCYLEHRCAVPQRLDLPHQSPATVVLFRPQSSSTWRN